MTIQPSTSWEENPGAPLPLAYIGDQDDLSTIDGDTVAGTVATEVAVVYRTAHRPTEPESNYSSTYSSSKSSRVSRSTKSSSLLTPPKKPKSHGWDPYARSMKDDDDDDERTLPETPEKGFTGISFANLQQEGPVGEDNSFDTEKSVVSRRTILWVAILGAFLLCIIGGLAVAYIYVRSDGSLKSEEPDATDDFSFSDFGATTLPPTGAPTVASILSPTMAPTSPPQPTGSPTLSPTNAEPDDVTTPWTAEEAFMALLENRQVDLSVFDSTNTPQSQSLQWLLSDPNFANYTESRQLQRYVVGVMLRVFRTSQFLTEEEALTVEATNLTLAEPSLSHIIDLESNYETNECTWLDMFTTTSPCSGFGYYQRIELRNTELRGSLPSELSLLDSLERLDLRNNYITGTIPSSLSACTLLEKLLLTVNDITGQIPTEVGLMNQLEILALGRNEITGTIPTEVGTMEQLATLGLGQLALTGTIPTELGNLFNLDFMNLEHNDLSGKIPESLGNLELDTFQIQGNRLHGSVPDGICESSILDTIEVECSMVSCSCCSECRGIPVTHVTAAPTFAPTIAPTMRDTTPTTHAPTECQTEVSFDEPCTFPNQTLSVSFRRCETDTRAWIAIYESPNPDQINYPLLWVWTCGTQTCSGAPSDGTVTLDSEYVHGASWPLPEGNYYVTMNTASLPYQVVTASSDSLEVSSSGC
eukprot:Nitzschia sp. Nitz4//scaffold101_size76361//26113//28491//NITZ4_005599-RA/size76361-snap-gene-0.32-mRNA-1//-1//CDS//3329532149//7979//frame0